MSGRPMGVGVERRRSSRLARKASAGPYSRDAGSTGLTSAIGNTSLDWGGDSKGETSKSGRTTSFGRMGSFGRRRGKKDEVKLPKNWKKVTDKDGQVSYENTKTHQRSLEPPPFLPAGWKEALHKETGRVYYYHKTTRNVQYDFPTGAPAADDDDDDDDDPPPEPSEGLMSRIKSFGRKGKGPARSGSFGRKKDRKPKADGGDGQKTVFISCSALLREVKLCVGPEMVVKLDEILKRLTARETPAEQAVKELMNLVGSTLVQQAGLSVMNLQTGVLPHGWLEYMDDNSGRPYYYNVHKQITTWEKPAGEAPAPPQDADMDDDDMNINIDCDVETHNVAMTGFI